MEIDVTYSPAAEDISAIYNGLVEFNAPYFPNLEEKSVAGFIRNADGTIIGGVSAVIIFTSLHVRYLWLSESIRSGGYGRKLLSAIELEAKQAGVENVYVDTYTFQAPGFYEKLGFAEVGRYRNYPKVGVDKIFYSKKLE